MEVHGIKFKSIILLRGTRQRVWKGGSQKKARPQVEAERSQVKSKKKGEPPPPECGPEPRPERHQGMVKQSATQHEVDRQYQQG